MVPMMLLYMLGVVVAYVFGKKRTKEPERGNHRTFGWSTTYWCLSISGKAEYITSPTIFETVRACFVESVGGGVPEPCCRTSKIDQIDCGNSALK